MATLANFNLNSLVNSATGRFEMPENNIVLEALNVWAEDNNEGVTFTLEGAKAFSSACTKFLKWYYVGGYDKYSNIDDISMNILSKVVTIPGYVDKVKQFILDLHADLIKLASPSSIIMEEELRQTLKLGINYLVAELLCLIESVYQGNKEEMEQHAANINEFVQTIRKAI